MVPSAVDNLSASALAVAKCRFLVKNASLIPEDTKIRFISFGSEEAGLRGSRRYVKRHLDELKQLDAQVLNFEMVAHPEIQILTGDLNGTVKHAHEMVKSVVRAVECAGVPHKVSSASIDRCWDRRGSLYPSWPPGHNPDAFQGPAADSSLLPPALGYAGKFDH